MMTKSIRDAPLERVIWARIRYYQRVLQISDAQLADYLCVCQKTLRSYDKNAENLNIGQLGSFLAQTELTVIDIIPNINQ